MNSTRTTPSTRLLAALAALPLVSVSASAQVSLVGWDFNGLSAYGASPLAPTTLASGLSAGGLTRGAGFTTVNTAAGNAWGGNGLIATTEVDALAVSDFAIFSLTTNTGFTTSLDSFSTYNIRRSSTGATTGQWQYQIGTGSFTDIGTDITWGATTTAAGNSQAAISLAGISELQNLAAGTTVTFRLVLWGGTGTGTWYLNNFQTGNDFSVLGTVSSLGADVSIGSGNFIWSATNLGGAAFSSFDTGRLDGTPGTVNLSGAVIANGLKFVADGYTVASPTTNDSLALTGTVDVAEGVTGTVSGELAGSNGLTKTGLGTLVLGGANTFEGNISLNAGKLAFASDSAFGSASNNLVLSVGSVLAPSTSLALGVDRDISGGGTIEIGASDTFSVGGNVSLSGGLTLSGAGTLELNGASNSVGSLVINEAATISGNTLALGGGVTTGAYLGSATISSDLNLGNASRAFALTGDLVLDGSLSNTSASAYLTKTGSGTLEINADNSGMLGGIQLGSQGSIPVDGGQITLGAAGTLGTAQTRLNSGTLFFAGSETRTFANSLSIGGRDNGVSVATLSGANAVFNGNNTGFFAATGTTGQLALDVDNVTTVNGSWAATGGSGLVGGIDLGGTGTLVINGSATAVTQTWTLNDSITFLVTSSLGGGVIVNDGTTFGGGATISGAAGLSVQSGATLQFAFDGLGVDTIGSTDFELISGGSGLIAVDFGGTALAGTYDLVTFSTLTGFTEGNVSGFEVINLDAGFTGTLSLTANALQITVSAIPEPSTFAALAGAVVLGCAVTRRRRVSRV